ncbi:MAG: hypothetical protein ABJC62_13850 [Frankiaceae bacterium]
MTSFPALAVEVSPGQSGPVGLLVIVVLCVMCVFLFRSMAKRLKRVPRSFPPPDRPYPTGQGVTPPDGRADV